MGVRVREVGESESLTVIVRIGVHLPYSEKRQTSDWSYITRRLENEQKQEFVDMEVTIEVTGASLNNR